MSKVTDRAGLGAAAVGLGALLSYAADNLKLPAISRVSGPDVVEVTTHPIANCYDSSVSSRIAGVPIPIEGEKVWEFRDAEGKFVAIPQRQVPQLSEGDFVEIRQWHPLRSYQALQANKE